MARESREAWARRVRRWEKSGLSGADFAAREGVKEKTLTYWRWKLGRSRAVATRARSRRSKATPVSFVEVASPEARSAKSPEVVVERHRIRITGMDATDVARLLGALEGRA